MRLRRRSDLPDAVADDVPRRLVHVVADVVERAGETVHVVAVERRHESAVEEVDHLVCQAVTLVLAVLDLLHQAAAVLGKALEELYEQPRDLDRVRGCLRVQREELPLLGGQPDARHPCGQPCTTDRQKGAPEAAATQ